MPRYVILLHETPLGSPRPTHWDLMFEDGDVLRTWALEELPEAGKAIRADRLPDHRSAYLTYEGRVSDDRGHVTRWDQGQFESIARSDNSLRLQLRGEILDGHVCLTRLDQKTDSWRFEFSATQKSKPDNR